MIHYDKGQLNFAKPIAPHYFALRPRSEQNFRTIRVQSNSFIDKNIVSNASSAPRSDYYFSSLLSKESSPTQQLSMTWTSANAPTLASRTLYNNIMPASKNMSANEPVQPQSSLRTFSGATHAPVFAAPLKAPMFKPSPLQQYSSPKTRPFSFTASNSFKTSHLKTEPTLPDVKTREPAHDVKTGAFAAPKISPFGSIKNFFGENISPARQQAAIAPFRNFFTNYQNEKNFGANFFSGLSCRIAPMNPEPHLAIQEDLREFKAGLKALKEKSLIGTNHDVQLQHLNALYLDLKKTKTEIQNKCVSSATRVKIDRKIEKISSDISELAVKELYNVLKNDVKKFIPAPDRYEAFEFSRKEVSQSYPTNFKTKINQRHDVVNLLGAYFPLSSHEDVQLMYRSNFQSFESLTTKEQTQMSVEEQKVWQKMHQQNEVINPSVNFSLFYHERQSGPYCQTCAVNNFLGSHVFSPEVGESLLFSIDARRMGTNSPLIGPDNREMVHELFYQKILQKTKALGLDLEIFGNVFDQLRVKTFKFEKDIKNRQAIAAAFIDRVENSSMQSMLLTHCDGPIGHIVALRRSPDNLNRWVYLDGNMPPVEVNLKELISEFSKSNLDFYFDCPKKDLTPGFIQDFFQYQWHKEGLEKEAMNLKMRDPTPEEVIMLKYRLLNTMLKENKQKLSSQSVSAQKTHRPVEQPNEKELSMLSAFVMGHKELNSPAVEKNYREQSSEAKNSYAQFFNAFSERFPQQVTSSEFAVLKNLELFIKTLDQKSDLSASLIKNQLHLSSEWLRDNVKLENKHIFESIRNELSTSPQSSAVNDVRGINTDTLKKVKDFVNEKNLNDQKNQSLKHQRNILISQNLRHDDVYFQKIQQELIDTEAEKQNLEVKWKNLAEEVENLRSSAQLSSTTMTKDVEYSCHALDFFEKSKKLTQGLKKMLIEHPDKNPSQLLNIFNVYAHYFLANECAIFAAKNEGDSFKLPLINDCLNKVVRVGCENGFNNDTKKLQDFVHEFFPTQ